jgi:hypothetical protein
VAELGLPAVDPPSDIIHDIRIVRLITSEKAQANSRFTVFEHVTNRQQGESGRPSLSVHCGRWVL